MKKKNVTDVVTPFDWQRYTERAAPASAKPAARREKKPLTVRERVQRILANRWGNPYCKPGAA